MANQYLGEFFNSENRVLNLWVCGDCGAVIAVARTCGVCELRRELDAHRVYHNPALIDDGRRIGNSEARP